MTTPYGTSTGPAVNYYDCCRCQTRHIEGEDLYRHHIMHQSKHGIRYTLRPLLPTNSDPADPFCEAAGQDAGTDTPEQERDDLCRRALENLIDACRTSRLSQWEGSSFYATLARAIEAGEEALAALDGESQ